MASCEKCHLSTFRGAVEPIGQPDEAPQEEPRMSVSGDDTEELYRDVQPKTYQVLEEELPKAAASGMLIWKLSSCK